MFLVSSADIDHYFRVTTKRDIKMFSANDTIRQKCVNIKLWT